MKTKRIWAIVGATAVVVLVVGALILPVSGATGSVQEGCFPFHQVQPDETLESIAELYGISVPDLLAANDLSADAGVFAGEELCIPTEITEAIETPVVEAAGVTTETLEVQPAAPTVEALAVPRASGIPTRICVNGQVIDKRHRGIEGVTVTAQRGSAAGKSAKTDKGGLFGFTDLTPGDWLFRVQKPDSWMPVTSEEIKVVLSYDHSGCYQIRFKLDPRGCIIAKKTDASGNPLAGWVISASGPLDREAITGADGMARIGDLDPGTYLVSDKPGDTIPSPWIWTSVTPPQVTKKVEAAWSENGCALVAFQNAAQKTSCIIGYKVDDNHKPLAGWKIYARPEDADAPVFNATTAADGSFTFPDLPLGTWIVWEDVPEYWTSITPSQFSVTLEIASKVPRCTAVRFKNRPPDLCAEGYKVDENGNGLSGWTVEAFSATKPNEVLTAVTDEAGHYRFNGLALGEWVIREKHQTGWTAITEDSVKVNLVGGECCTQVPIFRNQSPVGCIEGFKRDNLGFGLAGWNITLKPEAGAPSEHTFTDGTGHYRFTGLPMGKYEVFEELQSGWTPVTPTKYQVELKPSNDKACARIQPFINKQVPRDICIDGYKLDKVDDVGLPDWPVEAKNLATGKVLNATTDGVGYFRFSDLEPGEYQVTVGEKDGWDEVGPASRIVTVDWPPKDECVSVKFYNRQEKALDPQRPDRPGHDGCRAVHTVDFGETLNKIAEWEGTSVRAILRANPIRNADMIYPGQELCIP